LEKDQEKAISYSLPLTVLRNDGLSSGAKCLFAKLDYDAGESDNCTKGAGSMAKSLSANRSTIRGWWSQLERKDLIKVVQERRGRCSHLARRFRTGPSIPLLADVMERRDVGASYKLVICLLSYRQRDKEFCWPKQADIAESLGLKLRTVQRILAKAKAKGEVQIRMRGRNRKQGNKYALTCGAVKGI